MNIGEKYYCSRCFLELTEEEICPRCGHDPEEEYGAEFLEEGTLLAEGRYQVGVPVGRKKDCHYYGAWDHETESPVMIREFFPEGLADRNVLRGDDLEIVPGRKMEYARARTAFLDRAAAEKAEGEKGAAGQEKGAATQEKRAAGQPLDRFVSHGAGYLVYPMEV